MPESGPDFRKAMIHTTIVGLEKDAVNYVIE